MMRIISVLFFCLALSGCPIDFVPEIKREPLWPDIDLSLYESVPDLREPAQDALDWAKVHLAEPVDYWELRRDNTVIIARVGEKCKTASNLNACVTEFDATHEEGPNGEVLGVCDIDHFYSCYPYIVSNHGNTNRTWNIRKNFREFFGDIDSKEEAILLAFVGGFLYGSNVTKENGAIREVDSEYELILMAHRLSVHNITEERFFYRINRSGVFLLLRKQYPLR
jgi:hypothetical protein